MLMEEVETVVDRVEAVVDRVEEDMVISFEDGGK